MFKFILKGDDSMSKVAIASTDNININEHFGRAQGFYIYEKNSNNSYVLKEYRKYNSPSEIKDHQHIEERTNLLCDVNIVLAAQIGPNATNSLQSKGIISFSVSEPIEKALNTLIKKERYIKNFSSCSSRGCSSCSSGCS